MTVLQKFGFKIFRLKEVKEADEFLVYDIEKKIYNQYSEKRLFKILDLELYTKGIDYLEIAIKDLNYDDRMKKFDILKDWVYRECKLIDNFNYKPVDELLFEIDRLKAINAELVKALQTMLTADSNCRAASGAEVSYARAAIARAKD